MKEGQLLGLSPGVAFYFIMGFIPFLVFLINVVLFSAASQIEAVVKLLYMYFPKDVAMTIETDIFRIVAQRSSLWLWVSLLASAFSFEQALAILVRATDYKTYHGKDRLLTFIVHVKASLAAVGLVLGIILSLGLTVFGNAIIQYTSGYFHIPLAILETWNLMKYVLPFGILIVMLTLFYLGAPRSYTPQLFQAAMAAVLVTIVWLAATGIYSWAMLLIPSMGESYGPLVGLFVLFIWFRFIAYIIIVGISFLMSWNKFNAKMQAIKKGKIKIIDM